jgi:hypothetical protein
MSIIPQKNVQHNIQKNDEKENNEQENNLCFIHIGKTGGTSVRSMCANANVKLTSYHGEKIPWNPSEKYIIWIRNPIKRFVSAFYFSYCSILLDVSKYNLTDVENAHKYYATHQNIYKTYTDSTLDDQLSLDNIITKIKYNCEYLFSRKIDDLFKFFNTPNSLAESLYSDDLEIKKKAHIIMNSDTHIKCSIGYYLNNGNLVKNRRNQILFVGKQESFDEDVTKLENILNITFKGIDRKRENTHFHDKYLSDVAISNIIKWYSDTDYNALIELQKCGFITKETLDSYYKYSI